MANMNTKELDEELDELLKNGKLDEFAKRLADEFIKAGGTREQWEAVANAAWEEIAAEEAASDETAGTA